MSLVFSPQEIIRIAIQVEENGKNLYERLAQEAGDEKLGSMWHYLKGQEEFHRNTFQKMLDNVGDYIVDDYHPGEYQAYINAIASEYIFTGELIEQKRREGFGSDLEALDFAVGIEKDSILTYTLLRDYVVTAKQPAIDSVIEEERKHLVQLTLLRHQVK